MRSVRSFRRTRRQGPPVVRPGRDSNWTLLWVALLVAIAVVLSVICVVLAFYRPKSNSSPPPPTINGVPIPEHDEKFHQNLVKTVNGATTLWKAAYNKFASKAAELDWLNRIKGGYGRILTKVSATKAIMEDSGLMQISTLHIRQLLASPTPIPPAFDARARWPNCASLYRVPNQGSCGSCWAAAASSVISDRICIHSNGSSQPQISLEDVVTCTQPSFGCAGSINSFVTYVNWVLFGFVTGGPFGSNEGCRPYSSPNDCGAPCHWFHWALAPKTPKCYRKCQPTFTKSYNESKFYGEKALLFPAPWKNSSLSVFDEFDNETRVRLVQKELLTNGPLELCFHVYEDFQHYLSGVYFHVSGKYLYNHCVRLIGWGETKDRTPYWILINSWGRNWGQNGVFWIHRDYPFHSVATGLPAL